MRGVYKKKEKVASSSFNYIYQDTALKCKSQAFQ